MVNRSSSQMVRGEKNSQYCHGHAADHIGKIMIAAIRTELVNQITGKDDGVMYVCKVSPVT